MGSSGKMTLDYIGSFLSKLAEKSDSVYWLSSADLKKIQYISPAFEKIWGRSRDELYTNPEKWITFLYPDDAKDHHPIEALREKIIEQGIDARYEENYRIIRPDGEIRWIMDRGFPILDDQGEFCGVTGVAIDVTREKTIEMELRKAKETAEALDVAKRNFILNIQHDIRTPFSGIYSGAELLQSMIQDEEAMPIVNAVMLGAKRILDYCNDLIESGELLVKGIIVHEKKFHIEHIAQAMIEMQVISTELHNINMIYDIESSAAIAVIGDPFILKRLLATLLSNSIKFTKEGSIHLLVKKLKTIDENHILIRFQVADTGIGISEEDQEFIFEMFNKVHLSNTERYKGNGMGLYLAKKMVDEIGGDIELYSKINEGTTVRFDLPFKLPLATDCLEENDPT